MQRTQILLSNLHPTKTSLLVTSNDEGLVKGPSVHPLLVTEYSKVEGTDRHFTLMLQERDCAHVFRVANSFIPQKFGYLSGKPSTLPPRAGYRLGGDIQCLAMDVAEERMVVTSSHSS